MIRLLSLLIFVLGLGCSSPKSISVTANFGSDLDTHSPKVRQTANRHAEQLYQLPGVTSVAVSGWMILVYTDNPALVPQSIEGVPIETRPAWGGDPEKPENSALVLRRHMGGLQRLPGVQRVTIRPQGDIYVYTNNPAIVPSLVEGIPVKTLPPEFMSNPFASR